MRKYKSKLLLTTLLVCMFLLALATSAFCLEGDSITISYSTSPGVDASFPASVSATGGESVTLPNADAPDGYSLVWVTSDGRSFAGGSKVVFYEGANLKAIYVYNIETADDFYTLVNKFDDAKYIGLTKTQLESEPEHERFINVRLLKDITLSKAVELKSNVGSNLNVILNGYTLTVDKNLDMALGGTCFGVNFYGSGTVKYEGTGAIARVDSSNTTGAEGNKLFIGASAYVDAPNATLAKDTKGEIQVGNPIVQIYGIVNCKSILNITDSTNRAPVISIYARSFVTLNGAIAIGDGNIFTINIIDGTIVTTDKNTSFFAGDNFKFNITGGSFSFAHADATTLSSKLSDKYIVYHKLSAGGKTLASVFPISCGKPHKYAEIDRYSADCMHAEEIIYKCSTCSLIKYVTTGAPQGHTIDATQTTTQNPTPTTKGNIVKRCSHCGCAQYTFLLYDPLEDETEVTVDLGDGRTTTVTALVKDIFDINSDYCIKGIKAISGYTVDKIIKVLVPAGVKSINISSDNATLKTIVLGEGIDIDIISLAKLSSLESVEFGKVLRVKFRENCAPDSLKTLKTTDEGAKVTFDDNAFVDKANLTTLTMTKGSEYTFGSSSFKGTGLKKLELKEGISYIFAGESAFASSKLEYLYVGTGITSFEKKQFDSISSLSKIILMSVTKLADGEFSNMGAGCVVYHHASNLAMGNKTFTGSNGVTLYTVAVITSGFDYNSTTQTFGTTFTIMKNIKHAYTVNEKEASCTETGYKVYAVKDCPCGKNESARVEVYENKYTNSQATQTIEYADQRYPMKEHIPSTNAVIKYLYGFTKEGSYVKVCQMCKNTLTDSAEACAPMVLSLGFSISEDVDGDGEMVVKYMFNTSVLDEYKATVDGKFEYGIVFAARADGSLDENETPLNESGMANTGAVKLNGYYITNGYAAFQMKIGNIKEPQYRISFVMSAYVIEGNNITYIQENEVVNNPSGVTYKELKELYEYGL